MFKGNKVLFSIYYVAYTIYKGTTTNTADYRGLLAGALLIRTSQ